MVILRQPMSSKPGRTDVLAALGAMIPGARGTQGIIPLLSRYAPGGGLPWRHWHPFEAGLHAMSSSQCPAMEPLGDYPLDIVVNHGTIMLLGVVDTESNKTIAGLRAREVPGSCGVEHEFTVENSR
jgi:hypothetical protein